MYQSNPGLADNFGRTPLSIAASKGHRVEMAILKEKHQKDRISFDEDDLHMEISRSQELDGGTCEVCTRRILKWRCRYICRTCCTWGVGYWEACEECIALATCMDNKHNLIKTVWTRVHWDDSQGFEEESKEPSTVRT